MMNNEILIINPCPLCGKSHQYRLSIIKSDKSKILFGRINSPSKSIKRIKRLFTCPQKNEFFEAVLELEDDLGTITTVKVDGIVEEVYDGNKETENKRHQGS